MSDRSNGTLNGILFSLGAVVLWVILSLIGFIAGIAGALIGILFLIGYRKVNPSDGSKYPVYAACGVIIMGIILAELLAVAVLTAYYDVSYFEALSVPEIRSAMMLDVIVGLLFSFLVFGLYLYSTKKNNSLDHKRVRTDKPE